MRTHITEAAKLCDLIDHINSHYAAEVETVPDTDHRWFQVTVDQGGKTIYAAVVGMENPAAEAECRLIRHDLEQLIEDCGLPILVKEDAA